MKRKIYYIVYSILQFVFGIYGFLTAGELAAEEMKAVNEVLPESFGEILSVESLTGSYKLLTIISMVISVILFISILKNNGLKRSGLTIGLLIASFFTTVSIMPLLVMITFIILMCDSETKVKKKSAKKIPDIINLKSTKKDYITGVVLVLVYFGQILVIPVLDTITNNPVFSTVFYELIIFAVTIWAFIGRYKRDFKYLKNNLGAYVKNAFKYWGLMYLCLLVVVIIQMALGANSQSTNQAILETLPLWYLIPSAVIFAPVVEEAIFRGVVRRFIKNDTVFIIVSGLTFGLLHTFMSEETLYLVIVQSLNYVAMGCVMAYAYTKTNNIYTSMMVHAIQNTLGILLIVSEYFM